MGTGGLKIKPKSLLGKRKKINKKQQPEDIKTIQYAPITAQKQSVGLKESDSDSEISYPEIAHFTDKALRSLLLAEGRTPREEGAGRDHVLVLRQPHGGRRQPKYLTALLRRPCLPDACQAEQCGRCFHALRPDGSFWMRQGLRNLRQNRVVLRHEGWQQQRRDYVVALHSITPCRLSRKFNIKDHAASVGLSLWLHIHISLYIYSDR